MLIIHYTHLTKSAQSNKLPLNSLSKQRCAKVQFIPAMDKQKRPNNMDPVTQNAIAS